MLAALAFAITVPLGLDTYLPTPEENPLTAEKIALGKALFEDKRLSRDGSTSCATCHLAKYAFTDREPVAVGLQGRKGDRRTPSILNRAFGKSFFWDGRTKTLEEQVLLPITNPKEMDLTLAEAVERLGGYEARFRQVFGAKGNERILAFALASYVRSILAGDSPYDRYMAGQIEAMGAAALRGLRLFRGKAGCLACHVGMNFSDERLHNTGAGKIDAGKAFKTPTLRQVAEHPPYMHDGSLATLEEVVDFYNDGGKANPGLDAEMRPLQLTNGEKADLTAFLRALSGVVRDGN
ncbi:MAG: c-type cytochrome [Bryobacterales bacterium]|nr:c-type cytochrome [Bryobacterales bacterium]